MNALRRAVREHLHFIVVTTVLTLVMTFPTIVYVFRTDVFWLPTGSSRDVYIHIWDTWYGNQVLTGQALPFFTNLIFYPKGVSLAYHPLFYLHSIVVYALHVLLPISNAYSVAYLLMIVSSTFASYVYILWLFEDKWLALFGAIMFGFCSHVYATPHWPEISWIAPFPLAIYCLHRGVLELRNGLVILAGICIGFTSIVTLYHYVCILIVIALFICAMAHTRWRRSAFWRQVLLLTAVVALSSAWRLMPMLQNSDALGAALNWQGTMERSTDLISYFVDNRHPVYGPARGRDFSNTGRHADQLVKLPWLPAARPSRDRHVKSVYAPTDAAVAGALPGISCPEAWLNA